MIVAKHLISEDTRVSGGIDDDLCQQRPALDHFCQVVGTVDGACGVLSDPSCLSLQHGAFRRGIPSFMY